MYVSVRTVVAMTPWFETLYIKVASLKDIARATNARQHE